MSTTQDRPHDTPGAAAFLGISVSILNKYRVSGRGPVFCKFGSRVVYWESDLRAWAIAQRRRSTSDAGEGARA
jgi:hypothetical protein